LRLAFPTSNRCCCAAFNPSTAPPAVEPPALPAPMGSAVVGGTLRFVTTKDQDRSQRRAAASRGLHSLPCSHSPRRCGQAKKTSDGL
jgi:hypothetical protein